MQTIQPKTSIEFHYQQIKHKHNNNNNIIVIINNNNNKFYSAEVGSKAITK